MPHLDLSQWALEKLVKDIGKGVFGISYRTVDCKASISNVRPSASAPLLFCLSAPSRQALVPD